MLIAALVLLAPQDSPAEALLRDTAPACVQIRSYGKTMAAGSGFVFGARNVVVTSARVVAGASRNVVIDRAGNAHRAIGLVKDTPNDLAILLLADELACTPLGATAEAAAGAPAFLLGYPLDRSQITLVRGTITAVRGPDTFSISTPVGPGAGGAPVLGPNGELLGMASRTEGTVHLAVPASFVAAAVRRAIESGKPVEVPDADATVGDDPNAIVDDPNDANGEFAPAREAIENARRREAEKALPPVLPVPPVNPSPVEKPPAIKPPVETAVDPRAATSTAFARFWGGIFERKARWYVAPEADAATRRTELLNFVRDPAHRAALAQSGPFESREWDRALIVLESEIEEIALERGDPLRLVAADERLVARMRRRLWTDGLAASLDPETYARALAPAASAAPLLARFRAVADPRDTGAFVAVSANPELQAGDEITALVLDGGTPMPVQSWGDLVASARSEPASVALVVRRAGRTRIVGEPTR